MLLQAAGLGLGALSSLNQIFTGYKQRREAKKMNPIRPEYQVASEIQENADMARQAANGNMPGMANGLNNIYASTANAARSATMAGNGNNALAAIAAANANEGNAINGLTEQNAQHRIGQQANLQNQLSNLAGEKRAAWDWNAKQKYQDEAAAKAALMQSGMTNLHGGLTGISNLAMTALMGKKKKENAEDEGSYFGGQSINTSPYANGTYNGNRVG